MLLRLRKVKLNDIRNVDLIEAIRDLTLDALDLENIAFDARCSFEDEFDDDERCDEDKNGHDFIKGLDIKT